MSWSWTASKKENASLTKNNEEQHKVLKEKVEQIKNQQDTTERTQALEKETTTLKSVTHELQKKLSEKMKEQSEVRSKQRMHFAMVDACLNNMIQEKETPELLKSSLNLLKRCSQQFLDEDTEKEKPPKKIAKLECPKTKNRTPHIKDEPKQEYMELVENVQMKKEEDDEVGSTSEDLV